MLDSGRVTRQEVERTWPILEEMLTLFYPPFRAETDNELTEQSLVALRRYVKILSGYDRETLERGWSAVIESHKTERWPVIGVIDAECHMIDPQRRTARSFLPGERGVVEIRGKARPDFSYQVEGGLMSPELAERLMSRYA